ncbi:MAG: hypothetical protein ABIP13_10780 [Tepidiformaceae bacterium]
MPDERVATVESLLAAEATLRASLGEPQRSAHVLGAQTDVMAAELAKIIRADSGSFSTAVWFDAVIVH